MELSELLRADNKTGEVSGMFGSKYVLAIKKYGFFIVCALLAAVCAYVCFARLDYGRIQNWDEARHGVNAYEMLKNHNYIVNTFRNQNDYFNLKPPLSYWGIILGFGIFGVNVFGMRFYSAAFMLLTFLTVSFWLYKRSGKTACITSMLLFLTFYDIFFLHAARHADADSLYIFLFTLGCLNLIESINKPDRLALCGLMFSLCFLAKSWHACVLLPIGGLFLLFSGLMKKCRPRHYILLAVGALGPVLLWAVVRWQYDGAAFLGQMFGVDVADRIAWSAGANAGYDFFIRYLLGNRSFLLMTGVIAVCTLFLLLSGPVPEDAKKAAPGPAALALALWIGVPLVIFSLSHTYYNWYIYPIYPALAIAASLLVERCMRACGSKNRKRLFALVMLIPFWITLQNIRITVSGIDDLEPSGFQQDLQEAMRQYPKCHGKRIYVEKKDNEYKEIGDWEQAEILSAQLSGDLTCEDGGTDAFLDAPENALLMVDPYTYQQHKKKLEQCRILYRNEYLLLAKE